MKLLKDFAISSFVKECFNDFSRLCITKHSPIRSAIFLSLQRDNRLSSVALLSAEDVLFDVRCNNKLGNIMRHFMLMFLNGELVHHKSIWVYLCSVSTGVHLCSDTTVVYLCSIATGVYLCSVSTGMSIIVLLSLLFFCNRMSEITRFFILVDIGNIIFAGKLVLQCDAVSSKKLSYFRS